jgi:uncharacterized protein (TIGR01777 family)
MRILVSGSHGLIGSALLKELASAGHEVVRLSRDPDQPPAWDPLGERMFAGSLEGFDGAVNLAGPGIADRRWTAARKAELREARVRGTEFLARTLASLERPPRVLVNASAIGYYGDRGDEELDEASTPGEDFAARLCADWEAATGAAAGIRVVCVRSGLVQSARGGALARMLPAFRLGLGGRLGSGRQWQSWIALEDEVRAIRHCLERDDVAGPVNLVAPDPVTNAEYTRVLGRVLRRPTLLPVPMTPLRLALGRELVESALLTSQRVVPRRLLDSGFEFNLPRLEPALRQVLA